MAWVGRRRGQRDSRNGRAHYTSGIVKMLVFGTSDSDGSRLQSNALAWPWLAGSRLGSDGSPCAVTHKRYYAIAPGALDYLERQLWEADPDFVVLSVTLYAFSVKTVPNRVRRLAGQRAGNWAEARIRWFDKATVGNDSSILSAQSWRKELNRAAHWSARHAIGTASEASAQDVWRAYAATVERLAREEDRRIVVIGSTPFTAIIERENPRARSVQREFNRRLSVLCAKHRIGWVDPERMRVEEVDSLYSDALHFEAAAHARLAAMVASALRS